MPAGRKNESDRILLRRDFNATAVPLVLDERVRLTDAAPLHIEIIDSDLLTLKRITRGVKAALPLYDVRQNRVSGLIRCWKRLLACTVTSRYWGSVTISRIGRAHHALVPQ